MIEILIAGAMLMLAALFTLTRTVGWHNVLRYHVYVDVGFTLLLLLLLKDAGQFGIMAAIAGGLFLAAVLSIACWLNGGNSVKKTVKNERKRVNHGPAQRVLNRIDGEAKKTIEGNFRVERILLLIFGVIFLAILLGG